MANRRSTSTCAWPAPSRTRSVVTGTRVAFHQPSSLAASCRSGKDRAHDMVHSGAGSRDRRAGRRGRDALLRGRRAGDPCRGRRRCACHAGADQPDVCAARHGPATRRRTTRHGRGRAAGRGRRSRPSPAAHDRRPRPHRPAYRQGLRRVVRLGARHRRLGRRQHAGRPGRGGTHAGCVPAHRRPARRTAAGRAGGRRGRRRRQARQAIGGAEDLHARSLSGPRHPHRRSSRSGTANCNACTPSARSGSPCSAVSLPAPTARAACSTAR